MATLVLTVVGTVLGGPIGAAIGATIGQVVDHAVLFKPKGREGPRLADLRIQTSRYGDQIPQLFGAMRVAGTVIWATDLIEHRSSSGGGKGKPKTTTYSYSTSFAVALSARRIGSIGRIWADGNLLRGSAGDFKSAITSFRVYSGTEDQALDAQIAAHRGASTTPAHRGIAYAVFQDLLLTDFGNRIPSLTFEVFADGAAVPVADLASELSDGLIAPDAGSGLPAVRGYAASGRSVADALSPLVEGYALALRDGVSGLALLPAGAIEAHIDAEMVGARFNKREERGLKSTRARAEDVPVRMSVRHYDPARDYQAGLQTSERGGAGRTERDLDLPASLSAGEARAVAEAQLHMLWTGRRALDLRCDWRALTLEPGVVVSVDGQSGRWRIERSEWEAMGVRLSLRQVGGAGVVASPADAGTSISQTDVLHGATSLLVADLPMPGDELLTAPLVVAAAAGSQAGWRAAELFVEDALTSGLTSIGSTAPSAVMGTVLSRPSVTASPALFDTVSALDVQLLNGAMTLASADDATLLRGANMALVGGEVVQFAIASQTGPDTWRLTRLLRGRRGTEWAMTAHGSGEPFLLLEQSSLHAIPSSYLVMGSTLLLDAIGIGDTTPASASALVAGQAVLPLSPTHAQAVQSGGDWHLSWMRRSRIGWQWLDGVDAPLGEAQERYRIDLRQGGTLFRTATVSAPIWTYDAASIAADNGTGIAGLVTAEIRQIGDFGASRPASLIITI